jgi:hypothetical protein
MVVMAAILLILVAYVRTTWREEREATLRGPA